ncbi:hypothetical protein [Novosphingobium sp. FKTRR1]|uniref:phage terminase large subunit family protein n=1 Tax=Novosphingobium sp. FKTRR1 TaxID=2879118 RepID=UPI001CF00E49|nr:hypothetical protein [Novosphingobium sp. FKTRR1]
MPAVSDAKYVVNAGWDDVPHLDADTKSKMLAATPQHLRKARAKGEPSMGAGAIYPIELESIQVDPFPIPPHWRRCYGLDVGWNKTACIWLAIDDDTGIIYAYSEHYEGEKKPVEHASAIKARGDWIPGVIDPASRGRSQDDGERLIVSYRNESLDIAPAINSVEAGIYELWTLLSVGRFKVFSTLTAWAGEYRLYRRDEHGKIVKKHDHLMDASRYAIMSGLRRAIRRPIVSIEPTVGVIADSCAGY